jgi:type I restriction enzyme S subunit
MTNFMATRRLGDPSIAEIILGQSPPSSSYNDAGDGLPFFQGKADFGLIHPTPRMWCTAGQKFAKAGDVLMSVRAPVGDVNIAAADCAIGRGVAAIRAGAEVDPWFLYFALLHSKPILEARATGSTFASVNKTILQELEIPFAGRPVQTAIGLSLRQLVEKIGKEWNAVETAQELKRAAMRELFTRGLRGEPQKDTEIGPVPESWNVERLDSCSQVVSTRMSYTELEGANNAQANAVRVVGIKVSDMNRIGNETVIAATALEKLLDADVVAYRCAPPGTIVFPKRGAAIATNKKRLTETWSVFDPNVIGVVPSDIINVQFLFHWFQSFDLRTLTEPGPTPQLNKKHLDPLPIPVPPTIEEQKEIAVILDAIDRKIDLHRQKRAVLEELFKALLHKLMTGEIRVADLDLSALEPPHEPQVAA